MKYSKEEYYAKHKQIGDLINSELERKIAFENYYKLLLMQDPDYGKILLRIEDLRKQKQQFTNEHYSDFDVYTVPERHRNSRFDCMVAQG